MFEDTLLGSTSKRQFRKRSWLSWAVAYGVEGVLIGTLVLAPLVCPQSLPKVLFGGTMFEPAPPPPAGHASPLTRAKQPVKVNAMSAPVVIPETIAKILEAPVNPPADIGVASAGVTGGLPGGAQGGIPGSTLLGLAPAAPPPPPPPEARLPRRIQVGGHVEAAKLVFQPKPEYPLLARLARIQGRVRLEAVIGRDGTIEDLKVIGGHPLLVNAALEAVRQWRYQPTLLNGKPVEVETEIDVNFILGE